MDNIYLQPSEVIIEPKPLQVELTAENASIDVTVEPNEIALTTEPLTTEITANVQTVELTALVGANITNNYGSDTVGVTAAVNLGGHRIVTVEGYYASKDVPADKFKVLGMTTGAVSVGAEATVQVSGFIEESSWNWTVGNPVYLSTNGQITQTVPTSGYRLIIGKPKTDKILFIDISEPITKI